MSIGFCICSLLIPVGSGQNEEMTNPWLDRRVLNYAHQGGAKEAPSSTMFAFNQARANGADAFEMDVHATRDGHLVVTHDATIDRTTPFSGRIDTMLLSELQELDFAHWWSPGHDAIDSLEPEEYPLRGQAATDPSLRIAALGDVLEAFPDVLLNFDIKGGAVPYESQLADCLRDYQRSTDVIVASFHDDALARFRTAAPEIHTSTALQESLQISRDLFQGKHIELHPSIVALQIPYRFERTDTPLFDAGFVDRAHEAGLCVHVWTIDDPADMHEILDHGVDGIITDFPAVLEAVLIGRETLRYRRV
jgi:glycerophosphoryl diester phosphodiesterase